MTFIRFITIFFILNLSACGYHLAGTVSSLPPDIKTIAIPQFSNKTIRPDLENIFTNAIRNEFIKGGKVRMAEEKDADAVLKGMVTSYEIMPISFLQKDVIHEYRVTIGLEVSLVRKSDESVIWKDKGIRYFQEYRNDPSSSVMEANRDSAVNKISVDLSRQLYSNILEGF